jgi:hypothetical protein
MDYIIMKTNLKPLSKYFFVYAHVTKSFFENTSFPNPVTNLRSPSSMRKFNFGYFIDGIKEFYYKNNCKLLTTYHTLKILWLATITSDRYHHFIAIISRNCRNIKRTTSKDLVLKINFP